MTPFWIQRVAFEASAQVLGPMAAALIAGFAVVIGSKLYLTPDGERYLEEAA